MFRNQKSKTRRLPVKSMFMGVVGRPIPETQFDGRINLERVSETKVVKSLTAYQNFTDDVILNLQIKNGGWRKLYSKSILRDEIRDTI